MIATVVGHIGIAVQPAVCSAEDGSARDGGRPVLHVVELSPQIPATVAEVPGDLLLVVAQKGYRPPTRAEDGSVEAALFADTHQDKGRIQGYGAEGGRRHRVGCVLPDG